MHALAVLYMGPNYCPDFGTDYFVSPVLGPEELLAELPPLLMVCGEKDPFVDDTVIFAGRVREAKGGGGDSCVRVAIIEGWSHGFLQMSTIMPEVVGAIDGIADWINGIWRQEGSLVEETEEECLSFVPKRRRRTGLVSCGLLLARRQDDAVQNMAGRLCRGGR